MLNTPDPSYHGVNYVEALGEAAYIARARVVPLRNTGAAISPLSVFLILQGLETLNLRMERHTENAQKVAEYFKPHPKVKWVNYAGLKTTLSMAWRKNMSKENLRQFYPLGYKMAVKAVLALLMLYNSSLAWSILAMPKVLACHPATTTHRQLNEAELKSAGVSLDMVRLSVGIEHIDDLIADLEAGAWLKSKYRLLNLKPQSHD